MKNNDLKIKDSIIYNPCEEGNNWLKGFDKDKNLKEVWNECYRGDWMLCALSKSRPGRDINLLPPVLDFITKTYKEYIPAIFNNIENFHNVSLFYKSIPDLTIDNIDLVLSKLNSVRTDLIMGNKDINIENGSFILIVSNIPVGSILDIKHMYHSINNGESYNQKILWLFSAVYEILLLNDYLEIDLYKDLSEIVRVNIPWDLIEFKIWKSSE